MHALDLADLVTLVNDWGTRPREAGHRQAPGSDPARTRVADRLHAVFAAADGAERARLVGALLSETAVRPSIGLEDGVLVADWYVPEPGDELLAAAALALREHLAAHPDRVGVCADRQCADVYVDASPAGHRRFCSVTCQNRTRVAAFRARRRATTP
ncbi:MAG TPA: CGNR zinc finger domain-containing protein [Mycobacteriales bacterium]|nr:CGNR zinc finger domain-containing protein [Mycobacteriales bacterium]